MKKFLFLLLSAVLLGYSCSDSDSPEYKAHTVKVQLVYPEGSDFGVREGVTVKLHNSTNANTYDAKTDASGIATFTLTAGIYDVSATDTRSGEVTESVFSGSKSNLVITDAWVETDIVTLDLVVSKKSGLVIKEMYIGGCPKDDGSGSYAFDQYVVLYNNTGGEVDLSNITLAMVNPFNSHASNNDYADGKLFYEAEGWIPAAMGVWHFTNSPKLEPGKQIVIALNHAIDNTPTYSKSINFANPEYYCAYDTRYYSHKSYYSAPSDLIPETHYMKAYSISQGTAWSLSQLSPAFYIFSAEGISLESFITDPSTNNLYGTLNRKKVPVDWIVDGVEVFKSDETGNKKRLTSAVDAGYVNFTGKLGYTLYRNVDAEATKAIEGNEAKLVYNYSLGTVGVDAKGTTDPSGIDAEASIKNGARIIYMDTNNSTNDFHQRREASLRY